MSSLGEHAARMAKSLFLALQNASTIVPGKSTIVASDAQLLKLVWGTRQVEGIDLVTVLYGVKWEPMLLHAK